LSAALLCFAASAAGAQTATETPAGGSATQAASPPPAQAAPPQSDAPPGDGGDGQQPDDAQQTAENADEADCGCPKSDPAVDQTVSEASSVIAANVGAPDKICGLITPLVGANPCSAPDVIAAAGQYPEIAEKLAQCLSSIQSGLKTKSPESATTVEKAVACAPPAFQAAYSESLAPDGADAATPGGGADAGGGGPAGGTTAGTTGPTGGGGFGPTSTFGSFGRFGGGPNTSTSGDLGGGSVSPF
jgi:hypothetical protein